MTLAREVLNLIEGDINKLPPPLTQAEKEKRWKQADQNIKNFLNKGKEFQEIKNGKIKLISDKPPTIKVIPSRKNDVEGITQRAKYMKMDKIEQNDDYVTVIHNNAWELNAFIGLLQDYGFKKVKV